MAEKLTAQQRANLFAMSTRQNLQMLAKQKVTTGNTSIQFTLPKARLLSNVFIRVNAKINAKHATETTLKMDKMGAYRLLRRVSLDLNNGFSPYSISGEGLALLNMIQPNANVITAKTAYTNISDLEVSPDGTENTVSFTMQLPVTLNQRDAVGLILLQSEQTVTDLRLDVGNALDMFLGGNVEGYTLELTELEAMPMLETFSIPANSQAFPDLSVLKLCQDRTDTITSAGQQIVKLSTGTIYRKLIVYITDEMGQPASDEFVQSNLELVFNQADCNYSVNAEMLRAKNTYDLGEELPKGVYVFDFSNQGFANFGGTRDYIVTEKLTEFWLRFNAGGQGKVKIVSECLARLV